MGKSKDPLVMTFVFGTDAVDALYDEGLAAAKRVAKRGDGMIVKKKFNSPQEMQAYMDGIDDMDGWYKVAYIDSEGNY